MTKNYRLEFRLSKEQKERILELAEASGLGLSEYVLWKCLQDDFVCVASWGHVQFVAH